MFGFIEAEKANFPVKFMCERLGVTRGGFYAWRKRPPCQHRITDAAYTAVIKKIQAQQQREKQVLRLGSNGETGLSSGSWFEPIAYLLVGLPCIFFMLSLRAFFRSPLNS